MKKTPLLMSCFITALLNHPAYSSNDYSRGKESSESAISIAKDKNSEGAWLAIPIPMSNPTLGTGLQAMVIYMHEKKEEGTPNATSGFGGMYTDTESYFIGAFHDDYWASDRYRFSVLAGYGELNLNYFGTGSDSALEERPLKYSLEATGLFSKFLVRIAGTENWYGGIRYVGTESTARFNIAQLCSGYSIPLCEEVLESNINTSGFGLEFSYDNRDDNYYPTKGQTFNTFYTWDDEAFGSNFTFEQFETSYKYFWGFLDKHVLALKAQLKSAEGDVPFFMAPTLSMRGFDTSKYRDTATISGHVEWRYKFSTRWGAVAFYESGATANSIGNLSSGRKVDSAGGGIRWQATQEKNINLGIDFAFSDGEQEVYIRAAEYF